MATVSTFINEFWQLTAEMAPYVMLGLAIAGLLHSFVPKRFYRRHLTTSSIGSVIKAALIGVPLPLCSCGVVPTAMSLRKEGASRGAVTSFLIATPQTGVDSIAATYSMLGLPMAIIRPVAALTTALAGGAVAVAADTLRHPGDETARDNRKPPIQSEENATFSRRLVQALRYASIDMMVDIGRWLLIGLLLAALIAVAVPDDFFTRHINSPLLNMLLILAVSVPMYVCATGSIPIAAALTLKGLTPGATLVMLMAGPATNIASILVVYKSLGLRTTAIYIASIIIGAMTFGLLLDYATPAEWWNAASVASHCCHSGAASTPLLHTICGIALLALIAVGIALRYIPSRDNKPQTDDNTTMKQRFKVSGMMCNHCRANVERAIAQLPGVTSVTVDLPTATAELTGSVAPELVIAAVSAIGYSCRPVGQRPVD